MSPEVLFVPQGEIGEMLARIKRRTTPDDPETFFLRTQVLLG